MSRPHVDQLDRDALDDQALVSPVGDNTEDMRKAPAATEALQENSQIHITEQEF